MTFKEILEDLQSMDFYKVQISHLPDANVQAALTSWNNSVEITITMTNSAHSAGWSMVELLQKLSKESPAVLAAIASVLDNQTDDIC